MINGMVLPMQVQMNHAPKVGATQNAKNGAKSNEFGSILASMKTNEPIGSSMNNESLELTEVVTELLQTNSVEEVIRFLEENGMKLELPEVIEGHLIVQDEQLMNLLTAVLPNMMQNQMDGEENVFSIDLRELLAELEELAPELFAYFNEGTGTDVSENFSQNELMTLLALMQMVSIEGPKTDLTLKQEQQLHSLQEMLKSLGTVLNENMQKTGQSRTSFLPFMEVNTKVNITESTTHTNQQFKEQFAETTGQSVHAMSTVKVEGAQLVTENQNNSRAEQLMRELQNVFKRANFGQTGGTNRISIKLYPEHLGQLRIELLQTNGVLTARILASNVLGKEMLESQLHQLRQAFLQQNIQVERIDISQMLTETPYREREQAFNQQFKGEQQTDEQDRHEEEESMSFSEYMIELEG